MARDRKLIEQLAQRESENRLLREIIRLIGGDQKLQALFEKVADRARDLIHASTVTIPIIADDRKSYTYRAAAGRYAGELLDETLPVEVGICGWVFRHQRAWWRGVLEDLAEQERNQWEQKADSVILVPLVGRGRILGGIAGIDKQDGAGFDQRDFELLSLFARQVSVAIENAMYVEELTAAQQRAQVYREKLEALNNRLVCANHELQHLAVHDPLTGLPNRILILDRLEQAMREARRGGRQMAFAMIDLDHFKEVNDTLGHGVGDSLLLGVATNLGTVLREADTLGRLGGDEFALVLPDTDREAAQEVIAKLQRILRRPVSLEQHNSFSVSASVGLALFPEHGQDAGSLMKCADVAMYIAKRNRDDFVFYNPSDDQHRPDRLEFLQDLRTAILQQTMRIAFQPKIDLRLGRLSGVEVLARWARPRHGLISPYEFIPVLEQTGMIKTFTLDVLAKAAAFCKSCLDKGYRLPMAVNLSAVNLRDAELAQQIAAILDYHHLDKSLVSLEITESAIMQEPERSLAVLNELRRMGIYLSIDDFGTGYSSLSYLKRLPVKELKIDRSFVSEMIQDSDDAMIVRSTIDLAHNLGLNTVAEGVESEQVLKKLREMGCDYAQGFWISRPLSADDLLSYLKDGEWETPTAEDARHRPAS